MQGIVWLFAYCLEDVNGKDEIGVTVIGLGILWWSDIFFVRFRIKRRKVIADLLAIFTTFRFSKGIDPMKNRPKNSVGYKEREFLIISAHPKLYKKKVKKCTGEEL